MTIDIGQAALARANGARDMTARPQHRRHESVHGDGSMSASPARIARGFDLRDIDTLEPHVGGFASVTERAYKMWDAFGPYEEVVALDAFDKTLGAVPQVEFTLNHGKNGMPAMAHTWSGSLVLAAVHDGEETGLSYDAVVDGTRNDVSDMLKAMKRGDMREASFKFSIVRGVWSPDWSQYRIEEADLDRGDVSAVNFGASPFASSGIRQQVSIAPVAIAAEDTARRVLITDADTRRRSA